MLIKFFCVLNYRFCKQSFLIVCRTWISIALFVEQAWEVILQDLNHVLTGWPNLDQHFSMCLFVDQASEVLLSDVMTGRPDTDHLKQGVHDQRQERLLTNIGARSPPKVNAGEICISHPQPLLVGRNLMFAKGRRGNLVFSDLIFSHLVLSLLLFSHPFIALGTGGRGFIPNQPKRYYDAFVKVHYIPGIFTFSLYQTTVLHTKLYWKYQGIHIVELHSSHGRKRQESEGGSELPCTPF